MIDISDILIICHCEIHPEVFLKDGGASEKPISSVVDFVDPKACPERTWDKINNESKSYIWGINCPVGAQIEHATLDWAGSLIPILNNSWKILKANGKVIFPGRYTSEKLEELKALVDSNSNNKWDISIIPASEFEFSIYHINKYSGNPATHPYLAIFTKVAEGGRRSRYNRSRKYRSKKNKKTRKH
jgi:hypothetical protein